MDGERDEFALESWLKVFDDLFGEVDSARHPVDVWDAAEGHFSTIGEAIRRTHFADLMQAASHAFCWMCSFILACQRVERPSVFALDESLSGVLTSKYPLKCGHCKHSPCDCDPESMDGATDKPGRYAWIVTERANLEIDDYTLTDWLDAFRSIYSRTIHISTLESIGFHFLEEAGEEVTALRGLRQLEHVLDKRIDGIDAGFLNELTTFDRLVELDKEYKDNEGSPRDSDPASIKARLVRHKLSMLTEFADTFAWFASIVIKVSKVADNCGQGCPYVVTPLWRKLAQEYLSGGSPSCPTCGKCPCECVFFIADSSH